jgi:uncharacterized protein (TIGR03437 family)
MLPKTAALALVFLAGAQVCPPAFGQAPPTILVVDLENQTRYVYDVADPLKFATDPGVTTPITPTNFYSQMLISDIVAVNGQPVKGTQILRETILRLNSNPAPGASIADFGPGAAAADLRWEILNPDGTQIGLLVGQGFSGNTAPAPGAPLAATASTIAIVGGNGAFLGARGVSGQGMSSAPIRGASITEDPSNRRKRAGGKGQSVIYLIPMERPEIVTSSGGPAVFHSDLTPVTAAKPAKAGETLISMATGLGPTRPGVDPGQPFPAYPGNPLAVVNSPVDVTVNGQSVEVINAIGWPGLVNTYRVDFRVPADAAAGSIGVQLSAAWITGSAVRVPVQ